MNLKRVNKQRSGVPYRDPLRDGGKIRTPSINWHHEWRRVSSKSHEGWKVVTSGGLFPLWVNLASYYSIIKAFKALEHSNFETEQVNISINIFCQHNLFTPKCMKKNEYYERIHTRRRVRSSLWGFNHTGSHFEYGAAFALGETSKNNKQDEYFSVNISISVFQYEYLRKIKNVKPHFSQVGRIMEIIRVFAQYRKYWL